MMAAGVMALAITTSITTMQRSFLSLDTARKLTTAGQIMQSEFEKMRLQPWATIDAYSTTPTVIPIDSVFTSNAYIGSNFTMTRSVSLVRAGMKQITLSMTWTNITGTSTTRSYVSYYGQNGLYDYFYNSL